MIERSRIYLCAGGTGGHLFPAMATARALFHQKGITDTVLLSDKVITDPGIRSLHMPLPRRSSLWNTVLCLFGLIRNFIHCVKIFKRTQPELVVGFGGYVSVPAVLAAQYLKIPTVLHEQNAILGRANRLLRHKADLIATSFTQTVHITHSTPHIVTGNPVRLTPCTPYLHKDPTRTINLLIIGGSQGASIFSKIMPQALSELTHEERSHICVYQQCRKELLTQTQKSYDTLGLQHVTLAPFFDDMQDLYEKTDLIICRSGASTVSEVIASNRPAFFIPYPHAMDDHQYHNAKVLYDRGAAYLMRQEAVTPSILASFIQLALNRDAKLTHIAQNLMRLHTENAACALAQVCEDLLPQD